MVPVLEQNATYHWTHDPGTRMIYLGYNWSGNGYWHQFALVGDPSRQVWCEVRPAQLPLIERSKPQEPMP
jgi:hypothetical protein